MTRNFTRALMAVALAASAIGCRAPASVPASTRSEPRVVSRKELAPVEVLPVARVPQHAGKSLDEAREAVESVPFTIALPARVGCKLEDRSSRPPAIEVGLSREGPAFGVMRPRAVVARIGIGERDVVIDAEGPGLRLRAIAVASAFHVYAAAPVRFEEILVPHGRAELGVIAGEPGAIETSLPLPTQVVMTGRKTVSASIPCGSVRLKEESLDAMASLGDGIDVAYLAPGSTGLSPSATGRPTATLRPHLSSIEVRVLAREGRRTQIAWEVGDVVAVGWVESTRLRKTPPDGDEFGAGGLGLSGVGGGGRRILMCDGDVPLRAQVGTRTEIIGVLFPQTPIAIEGERPYAYEVDVPSTGLDRHEKAVLLVDKENVGSCRG
ncbi:MAG: hypothetical protein JNK04_16740 [Myxococcales bacterium]|nr:hypothetical protein [Myxococcales bacterium]